MALNSNYSETQNGLKPFIQCQDVLSFLAFSTNSPVHSNRVYTDHGSIQVHFNFRNEEWLMLFIVGTNEWAVRKRDKDSKIATRFTFLDKADIMLGNF